MLESIHLIILIEVKQSSHLLSRTAVLPILILVTYFPMCAQEQEKGKSPYNL